jgi:hypothetical protein
LSYENNKQQQTASKILYKVAEMKRKTTRRNNAKFKVHYVPAGLFLGWNEHVPVAQVNASSATLVVPCAPGTGEGTEADKEAETGT